MNKNTESNIIQTIVKEGGETRPHPLFTITTQRIATEPKEKTEFKLQIKSICDAMEGVQCEINKMHNGQICDITLNNGLEEIIIMYNCVKECGFYGDEIVEITNVIKGNDDNKTVYWILDWGFVPTERQEINIEEDELAVLKVQDCLILKFCDSIINATLTPFWFDYYREKRRFKVKELIVYNIKRFIQNVLKSYLCKDDDWKYSYEQLREIKDNYYKQFVKKEPEKKVIKKPKKITKKEIIKQIQKNTPDLF